MSAALSAVCQQCGGSKAGPFVPCKACGFTPAGDERAIAWLFSDQHLSPGELEEAALRVRDGERPDPSRALKEEAREAMGALPLPDDARAPLPRSTLWWLAAANVLLTPLAGFAVWFGYRSERPVAARQALRITLPVALGAAVLWVAMMALRLFG